jgi:hypothetical protein
MRQVVLILVAPAVVLLGIDVLRVRGLSRELGRMERDEGEINASLDKLERSIDQMDLQLRGVGMLTAAADAGAGQHVVSPDGAMEMLTWSEPGTGRLCAHWCARKGGPSSACEDFGPDRCLP